MLGASLLGKMLPAKGVIRAGEGTNRTVERTSRAVQDFKCLLVL